MVRAVAVAAATLVMSGGAVHAQNVGVFVSTKLTNGNMGGLAGADALCQAEGRSKFPDYAGPWKAWLSDSNTDARDRVAEPTAGGAYVLASDGVTVIASDLTALSDTANVNLFSLIDPVLAVVWTGTGADGMKRGAGGSSTPAGFCNDWTSSAGASAGSAGAWIGNSNQASTRWTENGLGECSSTFPLYCLGREDPRDIGVFVSTTIINGDMGGLSGADAVCQEEGQRKFPDFAGPWRAWLSDSNTDARIRVAQPGAGGAYVRASDGTVIASDLGGLTDTGTWDLAHEIDPSFAVIWTGTDADGLKKGARGGSTPAEFCDDWTSSLSAAAGLPGAWIGNSNQVSKVWTENGLGQCSFAVPLYCFGQDAPGLTNPIPPLKVTVADHVDYTEAVPNPYPEAFLSSIGTIKALMVFVDFGDYPGDTDPDAIAAIGRHLLGDGTVQEWFSDQSKGRFVLDVTMNQDGWQPMPELLEDYTVFNDKDKLWGIDDSGPAPTKLDEYIQDAMGLFLPPTDPGCINSNTECIDFSNYDLLLIVPPRTGRISLSPAHNRKIDSPHQGGGSIGNIVTFGDDSYANRWTNLVHELGHNLSLNDLYGSMPQEAQYWAIMSDIFRAPGLLGWHRFKLGWLDAKQTRYVDSGVWTGTLEQHSTEDGVSMIVVPARDDQNNVLLNKVFVVEVTQPYYPEPWQWSTTPKPAGKGVLVYSVDADLKDQPVKVFAKGIVDQGVGIGAPWEGGDTFSHPDVPMTVLVEQKIGVDFRVTVTVK